MATRMNGRYSIPGRGDANSSLHHEPNGCWIRQIPIEWVQLYFSSDKGGRDVIGHHSCQHSLEIKNAWGFALMTTFRHDVKISATVHKGWNKQVHLCRKMHPKAAFGRKGYDEKFSLNQYVAWKRRKAITSGKVSRQTSLSLSLSLSLCGPV
jgi:hypothetical protein